MNFSKPWLLVLATMTAACAPRYAYVPAANQTATIGGRHAAEYSIPADDPRGDLRIASFGFADVTPSGVPDDEDHALHALHLRLVIANNGDTAWTLDTREQRIELSGHGQGAPAFGSADPGSPPPIVTIPPGGKRVVDLFFPLPADHQKAATIPSFDVIWTVHAAARAVTERTPFDRIILSPVATEYDYGPDYWGPPYWYIPTIRALRSWASCPSVPFSWGPP